MPASFDFFSASFEPAKEQLFETFTVIYFAIVFNFLSKKFPCATQRREGSMGAARTH